MGAVQHAKQWQSCEPALKEEEKAVKGRFAVLL